MQFTHFPAGRLPSLDGPSPSQSGTNGKSTRRHPRHRAKHQPKRYGGKCRDCGLFRFVARRDCVEQHHLDVDDAADFLTGCDWRWPSEHNPRSYHVSH